MTEKLSDLVGLSEMTSATSLSSNKRALLEKYLNTRSGQPAAAGNPIIGHRPNFDSAPLSFAQEQVWLHSQMAGEIPLYNESITVYRHGALDIGVLESCLSEIVRRHEIWRTTFDLVDGKPVQIIHPAPSEFPLPFEDLCALPEGEREKKLEQLATQEISHPLDLKRGPLMRALLVQTEEQTFRLFVTFHQIVFDAVSAYTIFLPELVTLYESFSSAKPSPLVEPKLQYADFAYWQRNRNNTSTAHVAYWRERLAGELPLLEWPSDRPRPAVKTHRGQIERFSLPATLIQAARTASHQVGASFYMTLLASLVALLHRYTNQEDIVLGGFTAGRNRPELEDIPGYFVNPLPLRFDVSGNPTFKELQLRVRGTLLEALSHEETPFAEIVKCTQHRGDPSRNPLFQIVLSQQPKLPNLPDGWTLVTEEFSNGCSKLDLVIVVDDRGKAVFGPITYNPDLFEADTVRRMVRHWETLLADASAHPEKRVSELSILTESERQQILFDWNNTSKDYPTQVCLHTLIEQQVQKTPEAIALKYQDEQLSYRELNTRANQLAHRLRKLGVGPDALVAIFMERSIEMVVGLLGVLKAGGAYVPLDVDSPSDRLRTMLEDSGPQVVLSQRHLIDRLPTHTSRQLCLDTDWSDIARENASNPQLDTDASNAAYAIYTSGSTGKPKGVVNIHAGIVNRLLWMQDAYQLTHNDRILQKTPYTFDVSVWEFFWPLMTGSCLVVAEPGGHRDPNYLVEVIKREKITTVHFVPSMLQIFLEASGVEECTSIKRVICSGEALSPELQKHFFTRLRAELHNLYGPTEASVDVSYWQCIPEYEGPTVPIGRPIANMRLHVLDRNLQPVPVGIAGELHIGGIGLARGYLNRPELTAERFIPDPFTNSQGERLYKTGDLARYRPDGAIEFLGRLDDQVKIHGIRIELGEIEAVLHSHPAVREARVIVREDTPGARRLVAYVVSAHKSDHLVKTLGDYLSESLPVFMVPWIVAIDRLPVTNNGKLDRRALPVPEAPKIDAIVEAPKDPVEKMLAELWRELLGLHTVSAYDNFLDLGGDSLLAVQFVTRLQKEAGIRIKTNELAFQSLRQLAASCTERLQCQ